MERPKLEVADVFRRYGSAYRQQHAGSLSRGQRRVMSAIELCRTAQLGGHTEVCSACGLIRHAYNSCRNRHCPKCQGTARQEWLAPRADELSGACHAGRSPHPARVPPASRTTSCLPPAPGIRA